MHLIYTSIYAGFKVRFKAESRLNLNRPYLLCEIYHKISVRFGFDKLTRTKSSRKHLSLNLAKIFWEHFLRGVTTFLESFHKSFINLKIKLYMRKLN